MTTTRNSVRTAWCARLQSGAAYGGVFALVALLAVTSGCRLVRAVAKLPAHTVRAVSGGPNKSNAPDPVELQQHLIRFADDYSGRLLVAIDSLNATTNVISPADLIRLKLNCIGGCFAVATGPNPTMNLLDMFVLVTLSRIMVEEQWLPGAYGEYARPFLEACRLGETEITIVANSVLKPEQLAELRNAIDQWRQDHPDLRSALFTRALGLTASMTDQRQQTAPSTGSVFTLLMLDPLSGLDPAARELAQTRLFAERALFLAQRMPMLLRWQTELLALETAETPVFRELRTNTTQLTAAVARTSKVVQELPALARSEREEILKAMASQEVGLSKVAAEVKAALDAGRQMSDSVNTTLTTFDRVQLDLLFKHAANTNHSRPESAPFRVQDYAESAQRIEAAAERLTALLLTFDQTLGSTNLAQLSSQVAPTIRQAKAEGRSLVDYVFHRAVLLVVITVASVLVSALLFQRLRKGRNSS